MANLIYYIQVIAIIAQVTIQYLSNNSSYALIHFVGLLGVLYGVITTLMVIGFFVINIRPFWWRWTTSIFLAAGFAYWNIRLFQSMSGAV
jgi:hypothetical protein